MRTIIWFLYFWLYLIVVLPEYWRVCRMEKRGGDYHNREGEHPRGAGGLCGKSSGIL